MRNLYKFSALITSIIGTLLFCITNVQAQTQETKSSNLLLNISPIISLTITSPCDSSTYAGNDITLNLTPKSTGVLSSCPNIVRADTNTPGYSLYLKSSSSSLIHTTTSSQTIASTDNGKTPAQLDLNSWGFALPKTASVDNTNPDKQVLTSLGYSSFDNTYAQRDNAPQPTTLDKYATTPTTDLKVKELTTGNANNNSTVDNDRTTVYYATAVDMNTPAGQYKTTITYTALGVEIPPVVELACVSGLKFKGNVGTMSDLNTTRLANVGDTGIATDIRNNQQYCVGKLADNNIWMLDNLKLELGVTNVDPILDTTTLEPANSNIATSTPIDFAWSSFTSGTAAYSGSFVTDGYLTRDGTSDATRSNLDAWRQVDPSINAYCNGTNNDSQGYGKITDIGSLTNCGYLYNFYTATAGTAPQSQTTNGSLASGSICPANWQLPSGRNSSGDFGILDADYGGIGSTHSLNKPDTQGLWLPNGAFRGVFSGYWSSGLSNQGSAGRFWSRSVYSVAVAWYMGFSAGSVYPGDGYLNRLNGFSVRCLLQS